MTRKHEVESITSAPTSLAADQSKRVRRYMIQMSIRTVCLVAAFFADGWLRLVFLAGAVFLPYFAVIDANNSRVGRKTNTHPMEFLALEAERQAQENESHARSTQVPRSDSSTPDPTEGRRD